VPAPTTTGPRISGRRDGCARPHDDRTADLAVRVHVALDAAFDVARDDPVDVEQFVLPPPPPTATVDTSPPGTHGNESTASSRPCAA
jgi:hypothetical protein